MNRRSVLVPMLVLAYLFVLIPSTAAQPIAPLVSTALQANLGTAFTFQGQLADGGSLADGPYDIEFKLFDAATAGNQVGPTITQNDLTVTDGLLTVQLDFGEVFTAARFLEISVRAGNSNGPFTTLDPRQPLTPAPFAFALPEIYPIGGNVGVGTHIPAAKLDVFGGDTNAIQGVYTGTAGYGLFGHASTTENTDQAIGIIGQSDATNGIGIQGKVTSLVQTGNIGVQGTAEAGIGVSGTSKDGTGVFGSADNAGGRGVLGHSTAGTGIGHGVEGRANSPDGVGVFGVSFFNGNSDKAIGVVGESPATNGIGVAGRSTSTTPTGNIGVQGTAEAGIGVSGMSKDGTGVLGQADNADGNGVIGIATGLRGVGVQARTLSGSGSGIEVLNGSGMISNIMIGCAGVVCVTSGINENVEFRVRTDGLVTADGAFVGGGADYADMLSVAGDAGDYTPGDVLVIGPDGKLVRAESPYDTALAGVYSTQPAFVGDPLGTQGGAKAQGQRVPVALVGIVPVKVSAENGAIRPGDLLTTSATPGRAMKADPIEVNGIKIYPTGAILGKAMEPLATGAGIIDVLLIQR